MTHGLDAEKKRVRAKLRTAWRGVSPSDLASLSEAITKRLLELPDWAESGSVMLYLPMAGELDLAPLAKNALETGKTLTVPKVNWNEKHMSPVCLTDWEGAISGQDSASQAERGRPFIPAPPESAPEFPVGKLDLVIVPGLGFDSSGNRIGRGAGFYDRFLGDAGLSARAIALAPDAMVLENIPAGAMDAPVAMIVTESRVIRTSAF